MFDTESSEIITAKQNLKDLSEEDFEAQYKATKRQYMATLKCIEWLNEAVYVFGVAGPMDIDTDDIDDATSCIINFTRLIERMHSAAYWKSEEQ